MLITLTIYGCGRFAAIAQAAQSTDNDGNSGGIGNSSGGVGNSSGGIGVNIGVNSNNNTTDRSIDIGLSGSGSGSSSGVSPVTVNLLPYQHKQREAAQLAAIAQVLPALAPSPSLCLCAY